jgi:hypothetical protein
LSPDGRRVLFAGSGNRKRVTTAAANVNGTGYRAFRLPDRTLNLGPGEWSPDGRRIAFEGWDDSRASRNGLYTGSSADGGAFAA